MIDDESLTALCSVYRVWRRDARVETPLALPALAVFPWEDA